MIEKTQKEKVEEMKKALPDIQKNKDDRGISINRVGIEGVKFPLFVGAKDGGEVLVYSTINLYCSLRHQVKGISMSRFEDVLMQWKYKNINRESLEQFLSELRERLGKGDCEDVYAEISFPYFITKTSPMSKAESVMDYQCTFIGRLKEYYKFHLVVKVLTTSNCPCSREISDDGSHGQRSFATVTIEPLRGTKIWLEDLIKTIEECGSCEVYPLLKRPDEKFVTEKAYKNAKFVEDIVRDISLAIQDMGTVNKFKIKVVNEESIHPHDAVAYIARKLQGKTWVRDDRGLKG